MIYWKKKKSFTYSWTPQYWRWLSVICGSDDSLCFMLSTKNPNNTNEPVQKHRSEQAGSRGRGTDIMTPNSKYFCWVMIIVTTAFQSNVVNYTSEHLINEWSIPQSQQNIACTEWIYIISVSANNCVFLPGLYFWHCRHLFLIFTYFLHLYRCFIFAPFMLCFILSLSNSSLNIYITPIIWLWCLLIVAWGLETIQ